MRIVLDIIEDNDPYNIEEDFPIESLQLLEVYFQSFYLSDSSRSPDLQSVSMRATDAWFLVHAAILHLDVACTSNSFPTEDNSALVDNTLRERSILFCIQIINAMLSRTFPGGRSSLCMLILLLALYVYLTNAAFLIR